jgi:hypothetical protein
VSAQLPYKGHRFGRLIVTSCRQPAGAPFIDQGFTRDADGREYASRSILLAPWKKNEYGEHAHQRALTIGWRSA